MSEHTSRHEYRPSSVTPPGRTISDLLEERELRQAELAVRMGVTPKFVSELVSGKASITPATALALERSLDLPAEFWLAREAKFQAARARAASHIELSSSVPWLGELPLKDMVQYKWIPSKLDKAEMVETCLQFFGVASVSAWRGQYVEQANASAAYRASDKYQRSAGAVAAWLRRGELGAAQIECKAFDRDRFMLALGEARKLSLETNPKVFIPRLKSLMADCGVALVIERAPKGCPVDGAVRWLSPQKALIQLSWRYLRGDTFWFTFFHECGHIALHGKKILFLEVSEMSGIEEDEADRFAQDRLIPAASWAAFQPASLSEQVIQDFARLVGIHPGIVLGRLQKEERVPWNRLNHLQARYKWSDD